MSRWTFDGLDLGEFAPPFRAVTAFNPNFYFSTVAGRYVLLAFMPAEADARAAAMAAFRANRAPFDDVNLTAFFVASDPGALAAARDEMPGLRWFLDADGTIARLYGADRAPFWLLLDPTLRVLARSPIGEPEPVFRRTAALPPLAAHAGVPLVAPVLVVPRVFEPELCRRLIDLYEAEGGVPSGVMREVNGKTVGMLVDSKRRRDVTVTDPALRDEIVQKLSRRLAPEIQRIYQFKATRIERYLVACYDAEEGGFFRPHRDNETRGTAHRRFAVSINLNAEAFRGGDLRFPEFGPRTYRPPTGGAVVFSCSLQHEATPVTAGRRYAFLPFLYDEDGARIRAENLQYLETRTAGEEPNR